MTPLGGGPALAELADLRARVPLVTGAAPGFGAACFAQVDELADGLLTWCGPARSSTQRAAHRIKTRAAQTTGGKARKFCNAAGRAAVAIDGRLADVEH